MHIIIPSHMRADSVSTKDVVADTIICVPKSQESEYKEYNPDVEIISHPDSILGLSPKRQWIYKKFGDVFLLDDDILKINRNYLKQGVKKPPITKEQAKGLIFDTYHNAKQAGAKFFGFSREANPMYYNSFKPIICNDFIQGAAFGVIQDKNLFFPDIPHQTGSDEFIALINAYFNRYSWIDKRFFFVYNTKNYNVGGCQSIRNAETSRKSFLYLKQCFGDAVFLADKKNDQDIVRWKMKIPF